ncbi:MAG: acyltransferase family protein [Hyphomonadaceae bacterium]|nr:acyltransferase family protein [Hyphomonadaceae bacterium]
MYRKEIDGLRALAVLLVLLFHFDVPFFQGGFVGVDVFYVISGYLITRNIVRDGADFKLLDFFVRRVRRLMPAVWTTVALTMAAAAVLMTPDAAHDTAISAIAAIFSVSNFTFWMESGYWDTGAELKPLLHTWSLGVEEQFYLIWPFLLILARPLFGRWSLALLFGALIVFGLALSQWMLDRDPSAAFYLMPFRIMEFACGAILVVQEQKARAPLPMWLRLAGAACGLAMIVWSGVTYGEETPFPGFAAMIPAVGTALIIASGQHLISRILLENPISVYVGKISYSLYLTHWPIVSLYKYATLAPLTLHAQIGIAAATFVTGAALHHGVEKPFRFGGRVHPAYQFALAAFFVLALPMAMAAQPLLTRAPAAQVSDGTADWREAMNLTRAFWQEERTEAAAACAIGSACGAIVPGKFNIIVLGDSHGPDGVNMMRAVYPDAHIIAATAPGCEGYNQPLESRAEAAVDGAPNRDDARQTCLAILSEVYGDRRRLEQADLIVFSNLTEMDLVGVLGDTLRELQSIDTPVIVLGNSPAFTENMPNIIRTRALTPDQPVPAEFLDPRHGDEIDVAIKQVTERNGAHYISLRDFFCPNGACYAWTEDRTRLITHDRHHMSKAAAESFGRARADVIRAAASGH